MLVIVQSHLYFNQLHFTVTMLLVTNKLEIFMQCKNLEDQDIWCILLKVYKMLELCAYY